QTFLDEHDARNCRDVVHDLIEWMPQHAIIYAHDCFRSDQPIFEKFITENIQIPQKLWFFSDTLLHARANLRMRSYSLQDLVVALSDETCEFHHEFSALADANALVSIIHLLNTFQNPGTFPVPWGSRSVRVIPGIGYRTELDLRYLHGITTAEQVYTIQPCMRKTIFCPVVCRFLELHTTSTSPNGCYNETSRENSNSQDSIERTKPREMPKNTLSTVSIHESSNN
ncbi:MAG: hypothetical protein QF704_12665, partial [Anaerolineales bacterium]|nr:hypothetical protein [Anaerolineales bacterium]